MKWNNYHNATRRKKHAKKRRTNKITYVEMMKMSSIQETKTRQFIKRQLISRDGAVCAICGKPINNMKDCTIDHIVPVSKGGQTIVENCQLAHFRCNVEKGNS